MLKKLFFLLIFILFAFGIQAQKRTEISSRQEQLYKNVIPESKKSDSSFSLDNLVIPNAVAPPAPPPDGGDGGTGSGNNDCAFGGYTDGTYEFDSYMCPTDEIYVALPPPDSDCNCSYTWSAPGGTIITSSPNAKSAITVRYTSTGEYTVTGNGSCPGGTAKVIQTVYSGFTVTKSLVSPSTSNFCVGDSVPLVVTTNSSSADWTGAYYSTLSILFPEGERLPKTISVSNTSTLNISTSQIFGFSLPTAPIRVQFQMITARSSYNCSNTLGSTSGAIYYYPQPSIGGYDVEAPSCELGDDASVVINDVDSVFGEYVISLYELDDSNVRLNAYNIEGLTLDNNTITLDTSTTVSNKDGSGNSFELRLTPGTYELTIEPNTWPSDDSKVPENVCYETKEIIIPERPCITQGAIVHIINGETDDSGATSFTISGGTGTLNYSLAKEGSDVSGRLNRTSDSVPATNPLNASGLTAGSNYTFSVTDGSYTESKDFTVYNNKFTAGIALKSGAARVGQTDCNGENGTLQAMIVPINSTNFNSALNSVAGYGSASYTWNDDDTSPTSTRDLKGALAGTAYTVNIDLGVENTATSQVDISDLLYEQLSAPVAGNSNLFLQCDGKQGSIDLNISGGDGTHTVSWTGPGTYTNDSVSINGLSAGDYDYTVTDSRNGLNCTTSGTVTIDDDVPDITKVTDSESPATCATDLSSVNISIAKGTADNYTGGYDVIITGSPASTTHTYTGGSTPITVSRTPGSSFTVTLTKTNDADCQIVSQNFTVPDYTNDFAFNIIDILDPLCYNDGGTINFSLAGGDTSAYYYDLLVKEQGSGCENGGCLSYVNTDLNGDFTVDLVDVDAAEFDASNITISNIKPDPQNTYILEVSDGICRYFEEFSFASPPIQPTFTGITSPYQLTCYGDVQDVPVGLSDAEGLVANFAFNLERKLLNTDSYIDYANFDPISITSNSLTINDLPVGYYRLSGTDGNSCVIDTVEFQLIQPSAPFEIVSTVKNVKYNHGGNDYHVVNYREDNGSISVEAQGGETNYTFELYRNGNKLGSQSKTAAANELKTFTGLYASDSTGGIYNYTVKAIDSLTCDTTSTALTLREPALLELDFWLNKYANSADTFNIKCNGGEDTVFVQARGGIPNYSVRLENLDKGSVVIKPLTNDGDTIYFAGLSAANYQLSLSDKINTAATFSKPISSSQFQLIDPSAITDSTKMVEPSCYGGDDGSYTVTPSGGVPYFDGKYLIKFYDENKDELDAFTTTASSATLVSDSGSYFYTVQDTLSGCDTIYHAFNITEWPRLVIDTLISEYPLCYGDSTAKLNVYVENGRPLNETYGVELYDSTKTRKDSIATDTNGYALFENLFTGTYYVTIYDSALCSYTDSIDVEERADPLVITQTEIEASTCANSNNATITVIGFGGDGNHYYSIDNGDNWYEAQVLDTDINGYLTSEHTFEGLSSGGTYEVWLKDTSYYDDSFDGSCLISKTDTIPTTPELLLDWEKQDLSCYDATDGIITLKPSFGDEKGLAYFDVTIRKDGGVYAENTLTLSNLAFGKYYVELSLSAADACPTVLEKEIFIQRPASPLNVEVHSTSDYNCANPQEIIIRGEVTGGWPSNGYEYEIDGNGSSFQPFTPLNSTFRFTGSLLIGEHELIVRDSVGCEFSTTFSVEPSRLSVEILSQSSVSCSGGSDGILQITSPNGNLDYQLWNAVDSFTLAAQDTALFEGLLTGSYKLLATSSTCTSDTLSFDFTSPKEVSIDYNIINQPTCGEANGEVTTTISGGVAPYTTNWLYNGGQLLAANALKSGDYIVIVEDSLGCQIRDSLFLEESTDLAASVENIVFATCDKNNASISLNIQGGVPSYTVEWFNSKNELIGDNSILENIEKGDYYYKVSDQSGCYVEGTVSVDGDQALEVSVANTTNAICGIPNGSVTLSIVGGNAPYTVNWPTTIPVTNGLTASGLMGGIVYEVLVADSTGCEKPFKFSINNTSGPEMEISQFNPSCGLNNGKIEITSISGNEPFDIKWNSTTDTSRIQTDLAAGSYQITVTDADSCTTTEIVELRENLTNQLSVSDNVSPSSCGENNASINIQISGGYKPYQVKWADNTTIVDTLRTNLSVGTYEVTITDSVGCEINKSIVLNEVASPSLAVESFTQASCGEENGQIVLNQLSNDYVYNWSHDSGISTNRADSLRAGRYDIYADNGVCATDTLSFYISSPNSDLNISVVELIAATCESTYDGAAAISINGGVEPYNISWDDELNQNTERADNLLPDTYSVLVTDASGCAAVKTVTVGTVNPVYIAGFNRTRPSCNTADDGSIEVIVAGGTGNYSYLWSTGDRSKTLTGVTAGTYSVEVFDNDECAISQSITLNAPDSLSLRASVVAPRCYESANGSAELSISGGTIPYSVVWPDGNTSLRRYDLQGGDYNVEVSGEKGCLLSQVVTVPQKDSVTIDYNIEHASCYNANDAGIELTAIGNARSPLIKWSNGQRGTRLRNVSAGNYTATITDANGCATEFDFTITEPDLLEIVNIDVAAVKCNGASDGSINYEVVGGTAPYTYRWSSGVTSKTRSGLPTGNYTVLITDKEGCTIKQSFEIEEPAPLTVSTELFGVSCFGGTDGSASIEVSGGTEPYQIRWPDGAEVFERSDLKAGRYEITITDANNCSFAQRLTIDNINPIEIDKITKSTPSCYQGTDGSITIDLIGGNGEYTINWEDGTTGNVLNDIGAGTYAVAITDGNACEFSASIRLDDVAPINISQLITANPICYDEPSGGVAITPSGGSAPYKAIWEDGVEALERNDLMAGIHKFTIQDAEGCTTDYEVTLANPPLEELSNLPELVYLCSGGYITLDAGDWNTYSWTSDNGFSSTDQTVVIDAAGNYQLEVTNSTGCIDTHNIEIIKDDDLLKADFLLTSEAVEGDTVVIIDISWPMPDSIRWYNPDDKDFYLISQESDYQKVVFTRAGEFEMSMKANLDQCEAHVTKTINVLSVEEAARLREDELMKSEGKLQLSASIYPNPNYGTFRLELEGNQQHDINVRIVDVHKGNKYYQLSGKQRQKYVFNITDNRLPEGVYLAIIQSNKETITKRFVVK